MKITIKLFTVKYKGEYVQVEGIPDIYSIVAFDLKIFGANGVLCPELFIKGDQEAKDLCGTYGDFKVEIIDKEIEL